MKDELIILFNEVTKLADEATSTEAHYAYQDVIRLIHEIRKDKK